MKKLLLLLCLLTSVAPAQVSPVLYYTFDTTNPYAPVTGSGTFNVGGSSITTGHVGNCESQLEYRGGYTAMTGGSVTATSAITFQFAMKGGFYFMDNRKAILFSWGNVSVYFGNQAGNVKYNNITFNYNTAGRSQTTTLNMSGVDRSSLTYYEDEGWHVYAFVVDASGGKSQIYIDGILTLTGSATAGVIGSSTSNLTLNTSTAYDQFYGYMDEFAVYNSVLSASQIYQNYTQFTSGEHYTAANYNGTIPALPAQTAINNILDYAPSYVLGGLSSNITYTPHEQMLLSPVARYPSRNVLYKNFCWCGMPYVGGWHQPDVSDPEEQSARVQNELITNYNYSLMVAPNVSANGNTVYSDTTTFQGKWVAMAKRDTSTQTAAITLWAQSGGANVSVKTMTANNYLRNSSNQFLDKSGAVTTTVGQRTLSPAAPTTSLINDGVVNEARMRSLKTAMGTSILDYVDEDDEVFPPLDSSTVAKDPAVVTDYGSAGYPNYNQYMGGRQARFSISYRDTFMAIWPSTTHYSQYNIGGYDGTYTGNNFAANYKQMRTIGTLFNGRYYSTSYFYPRYPWNYRAWSTSSIGLQPIQEARYNEITLGDKSFSPFVAAGWSVNEEQNLRPGRWLGLLKMLGVWGADFYYTGYFNEAASYNPPNPPPASPKGYIWQLLMPSYAQAIMSRYDSIIHTGIQQSNTPFDYTKTYAGYLMWAGDPRVFVVARRDSLQTDRYLITATIQPSSNMIGSAPLSKTVKFLISTDTIVLTARQQGSTYELLNSVNKIRQLDSWHEAIHPMRWSTNFEVEAEVSDSLNAGFGTEGVTTSTSKKDFTTSTSYATGTTGYYHFVPRSASLFYGWILAKKASGSTANVTVAIPQVSLSKTVSISTSDYEWYRITTTSTTDTLKFTSVAQATYYMSLVIPSNINVDRMLWTTADTVLLPAAPISGCTTPITVTVSGSTPFCDSTLLTASATAASTYRWSTGATTSTIYAAASGTFTCTITDASKCSGSGSKAVVKVNCDTVCSAPSNLTADVIQSTSFRLSYSRGGLASAYQIRVYNTATAKYKYVSVSAVNLKVFVQSLTPSTLYVCRIRTFCTTHVFSSWSSAISVTTKP